MGHEGKHGVGFEAAAEVFYDPYLLIEEDRDVDGESRVLGIGFSGHQSILAVCHTVRYDDSEETIFRIISARKADKRERKRYGESLARSF